MGIFFFKIFKKKRGISEKSTTSKQKAARFV
jgi:hypothetical protein